MTQKEIENLNMPIRGNEIELEILKLPKRNIPAQIASLMNCTKHLEENEYQFFADFSKNVDIEKIFPNSFQYYPVLP